MKLIQRFGYYLGGFSLGLVLLAFFLNGKKVSCDYGPDARVLKNINSKPLAYSKTILAAINEKIIDSSDIEYVLFKGDINFSESDTRKEPCSIYIVEGDFNDQELVLTIENCDSTATLNSFEIRN